MADTPTEKSKRRAAAKPAQDQAKPARRAPAAKAKTNTEAVEAKAAPVGKPRKPAAASPAPAVAQTKAAKPTRAPRKPAAPKPATQPKAEAASPSGAKPVPAVKRAIPEVEPRVGLFAAIGTVAALGGAYFVWRASRAEEPSYQTVESDNTIEVRKYPPMVTAGTEARGARQAALAAGFRTLADYIFAKSRPGAKLPMTAPVLSDTDGDGSWRTRFVMPAGKARATFPATPEGVELVSEPARRVAGIRFSGRADDATLEAKEGALRSWLQIRGLPHEGKAVHAFYNAPFLPGPLRRNEVMIVLSEESGMG